jgi:hypothetical protein
MRPLCCGLAPARRGLLLAVLGPLGLAIAMSGCATSSAEPTLADIRQLLGEWHPGSPTRMSEAEADMVIARAITAHEMRRP